MDFGLLNNGFVIKPQKDIEDDFFETAEALLGQSIDRDPDTLFSCLVLIFAKYIYDLWQVSGSLYYGCFLSTAIGQALDLRAADYNAARQDATRTKVFITVEITPLFIITQDLIFANSNNDLFSPIRQYNPQVLLDIYGVTFTLETNNAVNVVIDGVVSYSAQGVNKSATLAQLSSVLVSNGYFTEVKGDSITIAKDALFSTKMTLGVFTGLVMFSKFFDVEIIADKTGEISANAGQVTKIITVRKDLLSIRQYRTGSTGRDRESDEEFRARIMILKGSNDKGTILGIKRAVLNLPGVLAVSYKENRSDVTNSDQLPPHSFALFVSGGDDTRIAQAIYSSRPAGISSVGSISINVPTGDSIDTISVERFSRSSEVYPYVKVYYEVDFEEVLVPDINIIIAKIVRSYLTNLNTGDDIHPTRINAEVALLKGVGWSDVKMVLTTDNIKPDDSLFTSKLIRTNNMSLIVFDSDVNLEIIKQ